MPRDYKRAENYQEFNIISDVTNSIPAVSITSLIVERQRIKKREKKTGKFSRIYEQDNRRMSQFVY